MMAQPEVIIGSASIRQTREPPGRRMATILGISLALWGAILGALAWLW